MTNFTFDGLNNIQKNGITILKDEQGISILNCSGDKVILPIKGFHINLHSRKIRYGFKTKFIECGDCSLRIIDRTNCVLSETKSNEIIVLEEAPRLFKFQLVVENNTKAVLSNYYFEYYEGNLDEEVDSFYDIDSLLIAPGYPSQSNKYYWAFIHSRMKIYEESNTPVRVVVPDYVKAPVECEFDGIKYYKINYFDLRELLQKRQYSNLLVHYVSNQLIQTILSLSLEKTKVYLYCHSADLLYRDTHILSTPYFADVKNNSMEEEEAYIFKDHLLELLNRQKNITFVFGTKWAKENAEHENNIIFNNFEIIPCPIDEDLFSYQEKKKEIRKKIVLVRKFDNINTYGIDLDVKCILELAKHPIFKELEFEIYGDGSFHDTLVAPLKQFENVKIHKKYLDHNEMNEVFQNSGIALFGTRYETQGVAAIEAAYTGNVIISNNVAAVPEIFGTENLCEKEDYIGMAKKIIWYVENPEKFLEKSKEMHKIAKEKCGLNIFEKEITFIKNNKANSYNYYVENINDDVILSIIIPSYNAQKWLKHGVETLISSKYFGNLEILVVNDGSIDNTKQIGENLEKITSGKNRSVVKLINKENGGHGSTINVGIQIAKGKYIKVMDSDDYFDVIALDNLIEKLKIEDSDLVLTDYIEDWSNLAQLKLQKYYEFMEQGKQYNIEDLCYAGYGFNRYANILHTSTFKADLLKNSDFRLSEHCFYVDMELNTFAFIQAKTVTRYPYSLYVYYLGRNGQSVSPESFKKNYKQHEHVLLKILDMISNEKLSYGKKHCLYRTIVLPMIETQYYILTNYLQDLNEFERFDNKIKQYSDLYLDPYISKGNTIVYRNKMNAKKK